MHMQDAYGAYLCRQRERRRGGITALRHSCHTHMAVRLTCDKEDINKLKKYFLRHGFFNIFVNLRSKTGTLSRIGHQTSILISCCCQPDCILLYRRCSGLHQEKAGYKMTAAVRKKDEELTINIKCTIGVLMTDSGLCHTDGKAVRTVMMRGQDTTNNHKQKKR